MMISDLPSDLLEDIFCRLPLTSMRAVRLTCKRWNNLSKSQIFTRLRFGKEEAEARELGESRMIVLRDHKLYLMSPVVNVNVIPCTKPKAKLSFLKKQVEIYHVFYCEGILVCSLKNDTRRIVVWNPSFGQTRSINTRYFETRGFDGYTAFRYALGYDNKKKRCCRNHKILRFIDNRLSLAGYEFSQYEIYDFDSSLWTTLEFTPQWLIPFDQCGVSLKGNAYWCATQNRSFGLISFDFARERFGPLLHLPFHAKESDVVTLSCVREEKLAVLFQSLETFVTEIWITSNIDAVSWSNILITDQVRINEGSFFIDEEKKVAMVFNKLNKNKRLDTITIYGEDGYFREFKLGKPSDKYCRLCVWPYVLSSVQIKQSKHVRDMIKESIRGG